MIRRAIAVGLAGGLIISLAGLYPLVGLFAPAVVPGWFPPLANPLLNSLALMISAAIAVPAFFLGGALAVPRRPIEGWTQGVRSGLLAGATAGSGIYMTLIAPLNALVAYGRLAPHLPSLVAAQPLPGGTLASYVDAFGESAFSPELTLGIFALVWGIVGAFVGWRRGEHAPPPKPSLLALVAEGQPKQWFADNETAVQIGLRIGVAFGLLALITTFGWFYAGLAQELPQFESIMPDSRMGMVTGSLGQVLAALSPLFVVALFSFGVIIVSLIKNPPDRFIARGKAVILAALVIAVFMGGVGLNALYFNLGLAPFLLSQEMQRNPEDVLPVLLQLRQVLDTQAVPSLLVGMTLLTAWSALTLVVAGGAILGGIQALFSVLTVPLLVKRPVDRAVQVQREIEQQPAEILPILYALCGTDSAACDILAHLTVRFAETMPDAARLTAAYHTLGCRSSREEHVAALAAIRETLAAHPEWRWSSGFLQVYETLYAVMTARRLEDVSTIRLPVETAGELPEHMSQSLGHVSAVIGELQKSNKVDDLPTRLIFLENALAGIHDAQRFAQGAPAEVAGSLVLPQRIGLADALEHWQGIVLAAIKRLKGRADIVCTLQTQLCNACAQLPLVWRMENRGLNVAQEVRLRLLPGADYAIDARVHEIDILPPGEEKLVSLTIYPRHDLPRLRVEWEILYDDAVVDDRRLLFADVIEFEEQARPFQRVFPIPYVTGTPLKTDDVFVGRQDVFAFIRESLLGAHQNNVIILHGQRRTGKTSVLYRLGQIMADTHVAVLIDMQGKPARGEADFLFSIADDIVFALEEAGLEIDMPRYEDFLDAPEFFFSARFLRQIRPLLGEKNLLLLFDEFEELQRRVEAGRLQPEIFQFLRNLMQHEERLDFVFSGTHRLEDLSADYWSILFNIAAYKPITFLAPGEVERLMTEPVWPFGIEYDPLAGERIMQVTAGHPYFTQLVLHEMMVYHNETERNYLTLSDVEKVIERILERGEAHFKHIWAESAADEREVLTGLAELLNGRTVVAKTELQAHLHQQGYESADTWQAALDTLSGRDILNVSNERAARYRYKIDLIRQWIERSRPSL